VLHPLLRRVSQKQVAWLVFLLDRLYNNTTVEGHLIYRDNPEKKNLNVLFSLHVYTVKFRFSIY